LQNNIAFFDFDGTITRKDTMFEMVKFSHGKTGFYKGLLKISPWLVGLKLGLVSAQKAKEELLRQFYSGFTLEAFNRTCELFTTTILPSLIRPDALARLKQHKTEGTVVVVVSASLENWVSPWCKEQQIVCIGSRLEIKGGEITGKLEGSNCNGPEKVNRILLAYDPAQFDVIYSYGDTEADKEMLAIAHKPAFKLFVQ
jgi:HAD superfamily hydrolase (TIGR01490 family)